MKHILVNSFDVRNGDIEVLIENEKRNLSIEVVIPECKFAKFLKDTGRLEYESNSSDSSGEHVQISGSLTPDHYYNNYCDDVKKDIKEYITTHPITYRGEVYQDANASILTAFKNHKK